MYDEVTTAVRLRDGEEQRVRSEGRGPSGLRLESTFIYTLPCKHYLERSGVVCRGSYSYADDLDLMAEVGGQN